MCFQIIPQKTMNNLVNEFMNSVTHAYINTNVPFVFIGWSMGAAIIIQALIQNNWLQAITKSVILIAHQTDNKIEIKNLNFKYELIIFMWTEIVHIGKNMK